MNVYAQGMVKRLENAIKNCKQPHTGEWMMGCQNCTENALAICQIQVHGRAAKTSLKDRVLNFISVPIFIFFALILYWGNRNQYE